MCRVGSDADGPGREHWTAMLANPRKPIEHWHQLVEVETLPTPSVFLLSSLRLLLKVVSACITGLREMIQGDHSGLVNCALP